MKAYLGSKNIVKLNATIEVLSEYGYDVVDLDVDSMVGAQPKNDGETMHGAYNRAIAPSLCFISSVLKYASIASLNSYPFSKFSFHVLITKTNFS